MHFSTSITHTILSLLLLVFPAIVTSIPAPHPIFEDNICNQACNANMCKPGGYCDCKIGDQCIGNDQSLQFRCQTSPCCDPQHCRPSTTPGPTNYGSYGAYGSYGSYGSYKRGVEREGERGLALGRGRS